MEESHLNVCLVLIIARLHGLFYSIPSCSAIKTSMLNFFHPLQLIIIFIPMIISLTILLDVLSKFIQSVGIMVTTYSISRRDHVMLGTSFHSCQESSGKNVKNQCNSRSRKPTTCMARSLRSGFIIYFLWLKNCLNCKYVRMCSIIRFVCIYFFDRMVLPPSQALINETIKYKEEYNA